MSTMNTMNLEKLYRSNFQADILNEIDLYFANNEIIKGGIMDAETANLYTKSIEVVNEACKLLINDPNVIISEYKFHVFTHNEWFYNIEWTWSLPVFVFIYKFPVKIDFAGISIPTDRQDGWCGMNRSDPFTSPNISDCERELIHTLIENIRIMFSSSYFHITSPYLTCVFDKSKTCANIPLNKSADSKYIRSVHRCRLIFDDEAVGGEKVCTFKLDEVRDLTVTNPAGGFFMAPKKPYDTPLIIDAPNLEELKIEVPLYGGIHNTYMQLCKQSLHLHTLTTKSLFPIESSSLKKIELHEGWLTRQNNCVIVFNNTTTPALEDLYIKCVFHTNSAIVVDLADLKNLKKAYIRLGSLGDSKFPPILDFNIDPECKPEKVELACSQPPPVIKVNADRRGFMNFLRAKEVILHNDNMFVALQKYFDVDVATKINKGVGTGDLTCGTDGKVYRANLQMAQQFIYFENVRELTLVSIDGLEFNGQDFDVLVSLKEITLATGIGSVEPHILVGKFFSKCTQLESITLGQYTKKTCRKPPKFYSGKSLKKLNFIEMEPSLRWSDIATHISNMYLGNVTVFKLNILDEWSHIFWASDNEGVSRVTKKFCDFLRYRLHNLRDLTLFFYDNYALEYCVRLYLTGWIDGFRDFYNLKHLATDLNLINENTLRNESLITISSREKPYEISDADFDKRFAILNKNSIFNYTNPQEPLCIKI